MKTQAQVNTLKLFYSPQMTWVTWLSIGDLCNSLWYVLFGDSLFCSCYHEHTDLFCLSIKETLAKQQEYLKRQRDAIAYRMKKLSAKQADINVS